MAPPCQDASDSELADALNFPQTLTSSMATAHDRTDSLPTSTMADESSSLATGVEKPSTAGPSPVGHPSLPPQELMGMEMDVDYPSPHSETVSSHDNPNATGLASDVQSTERIPTSTGTVLTNSASSDSSTGVTINENSTPTNKEPAGSAFTISHKDMVVSSHIPTPQASQNDSIRLKFEEDGDHSFPNIHNAIQSFPGQVTGKSKTPDVHQTANTMTPTCTFVQIPGNLNANLSAETDDAIMSREECEYESPNTHVVTTPTVASEIDTTTQDLDIESRDIRTMQLENKAEASTPLPEEFSELRVLGDVPIPTPNKLPEDTMHIIKKQSVASKRKALDDSKSETLAKKHCAPRRSKKGEKEEPDSIRMVKSVLNLHPRETVPEQVGYAALPSTDITRRKDQWSHYRESAHPDASRQDIARDNKRSKEASQYLGPSRCKADNMYWLLNRTRTARNITVRMKSPLHNHQMEAVAQMARIEKTHSGGILASSMGMGKTLQMIGLVVVSPAGDDKLSDDQNRQVSLMVVGPRALQQTFDMINTHSAGLKAAKYLKSSRTENLASLAVTDIIVTSYPEVQSARKALNELLVSHGISEDNWREEVEHKGIEDEVPVLYRIPFFRVFLDESHEIRNYDTLKANACLTLDTKMRWCVSATPFVNDLDDLFPQLNFIGSDEAKDYGQFHAAYAQLSKEEAVAKLAKTLEEIMIRRLGTDKEFGWMLYNAPTRVGKLHIVTPSEPEVMMDEFVKSLGEDVVANTNGDANGNAEEDEAIDIESTKANGTKSKDASKPVKEFLRRRQAASHFYSLEPLVAKQSVDTLKTARDTFPIEDSFGLRKMFNIAIAIKEDTCGLCMKRLSEGFSLDKCGHVFCENCIESHNDKKTDEEQHQCPVCKTRWDEMTEIDLVKTEDDGGPQRTEPRAPRVIRNLKGKSRGPKRNDLGRDYNKSHADLPELTTRWLQTADKEDPDAPMRTAKMKKLQEIMLQIRRDHPDDKVIIFFQFHMAASVIGRMLRKHGLGFNLVLGGMSKDKTDKAIQNLIKNSEVSVLLASLKCFGQSLNLTFANHVIIFDPYWNVAVEDQALARVDRIGQTKDKVYFHRIVTKGTVEERVVEIRERKRAAAETLMNGRISWEDLEFVMN
ncbi:putative dna repair helicase protein [Seiridium cardinale]|uniref:Dna repair helicase protein n=1 Tax=Seiridium cardinale TaxID=138064 RepID=A0ABR2XXT7_9PEZI